MSDKTKPIAYEYPDWWEQSATSKSGTQSVYPEYKTGATSKVQTSGSKSTYTPCHESHKPLKLGTGEVFGGSCMKPRDGFDIYVGLDYGMEMKPRYPWEDNSQLPIEIKVKIVDGNAPADTELFKRMIDWLCNQLQDGKRVHVGCIGGHGRTGIVLSALVMQVTGNKDAIKWVRENHCKKAVETKTQVEWLMKHYGVTEAKPSKSVSGYSAWPESGGKKGAMYQPKSVLPEGCITLNSMAGACNIFETY